MTPPPTLNTHAPGRYLSPHFHIADQFQVFVQGRGTLGKHEVSPYLVHFTKAHSTYGPLLAGEETGYAFMTLRTRFDPGQVLMPENRERLKLEQQEPPFQVTEQVTFEQRPDGTELRDIPGFTGQEGLFVKALSMAPGTRATMPDPGSGDGQYVLALRGTLVHDGAEREGLTVAFVKPDEEPLEIEAGQAGLDALVLNFPRR